MELDAQLIRAAKANDADRVRELIAAGGDVNAKDAIQDSAFLYAGAEGFNEVLQLTLAAGADCWTPAPIRAVTGAALALPGFGPSARRRASPSRGAGRRRA